MPRRVKLDFEPLTLRETAAALGLPPTRARKILAMVGVDFDGRPANKTRAPSVRRRKNPSRATKGPSRSPRA
jgi:hypothetical protein